MDVDEVQIGQLEQVHGALQAILTELRREREWGGIAAHERVRWTAGASAEYSHDGTFHAVGIYNLSSTTIRVALTPNASTNDRTSDVTIGPHGYLVLPIRGNTVSVSGDDAGSALIVAFSTPQPASGSNFGASTGTSTIPGEETFLGDELLAVPTTAGGTALAAVPAGATHAYIVNLDTANPVLLRLNRSGGLGGNPDATHGIPIVAGGAFDLTTDPAQVKLLAVTATINVFVTYFGGP